MVPIVRLDVVLLKAVFLFAVALCASLPVPLQDAWVVLVLPVMWLGPGTSW